MDRRSRPAARKSDIYSTMVIHSDSGSGSESDAGDSGFGTVVYKGGRNRKEEEEDHDSLPPLLKCLPKDFGGGDPLDDEDEDEGVGDFGTMIVNPTRKRNTSSSFSAASSFRRRSAQFGPRRGDESEEEEEEEGEGFGTFVVKKEGRGELSTMGRAVASMKASSELGRRKADPVRQHPQGGSKVSSSSIPDSVTREDPSTKYEMLNELGKGSYGAVYKARDLLTSELVAIKVISLTEGEEGYEEIRGEIEMLQQCNHPNVVRYLGSYQGEDYLWIVMEYCGGGSVADLMNVTDEPLEEYQIAYICREALKGLAYLHSIFKVHRDIKGGNILLTEQGEVKLGDFGVAAQLTRTMSKRNTFIGTPHWMAPEVIQESRYDGKVDVWALGVSAIEMAEISPKDLPDFHLSSNTYKKYSNIKGLPPRSAVHPMRVLFMISIEPAPMLEDKEKWSLVFHDFVAKCLTKDTRLRPTASEMRKHKFIERCTVGASAMVPKIEKARQIRASMSLEAQNLGQDAIESPGPRLNDDYGDTVLAKRAVDELPSSSSGVESATGVDFGTVVIHGDEGMDDVVMRTTVDNSAAVLKSLGNVEHSSITAGGELADSRVDETCDITRDNTVILKNVQASLASGSGSGSGSPDQNLKPSSSSPVNFGDGGVASALKNDTVNKKAFALQDKLWSIYAAGNTVPIPFLRATDISPIALLSDNVIGGVQRDSNGTAAVEALQELFNGDGLSRKGRRGQNEIPLPPSVYRRLTSSPTLMNLASALAYHKTCYDEMPLQELQATQEQQAIQNLCDTLRTILRL